MEIERGIAGVRREILIREAMGFRGTLNKSLFCSEPAQLRDAGCCKIRGLA